MSVVGADFFVSGDNITPSDETGLSNVAHALYIGGVPEDGKGQILVEMEDSGAVRFSGLSAGDELSIRATKVYKTGTTATDIVALYNTRLGEVNKASQTPWDKINFRNPVDREKYLYGELSPQTCPSIDDSYRLSSFPRTMIDRNGCLCYQSHNLLRETNQDNKNDEIRPYIPLLNGSKYKLWWRGRPTSEYGSYVFYDEYNKEIESGELKTDEDGNGSHDFIALKPKHGMKVFWEGSSLIEPDNIGLVATNFRIEGPYLGIGDSRMPRPRRDYISGSVIDAGCLIESATCMNLFPRSQPGRTWSGNVLNTDFRLSTTAVPKNPAGNEGSYVLFHSSYDDPREALVYDRLRCPHPIACQEGGPITFSAFLRPIFSKKIEVRMEYNSTASDPSPQTRVIVTFDFETLNRTIRNETSEGTATDWKIPCTSTTMVEYAGGWHRISVSLLPSCKHGLSLDICPVQADVIQAVEEKNLHNRNPGYFSVWGLQIEHNDLPTSYLPTYGQILQQPGEYLRLADRFLHFGDLVRRGVTIKVDFSLPPYFRRMKDHTGNDPEGENSTPHHLLWWCGCLRDTSDSDFGYLFYITGLGTNNILLWIVNIDDSKFFDGKHPQGPGEPPDFRVMSIPIKSISEGLYSCIFTAKNYHLIAFLNRTTGTEQLRNELAPKCRSFFKADVSGLGPLNLWNWRHKGHGDKEDMYNFLYALCPESISIADHAMDYPELLNSEW